MFVALVGEGKVTMAAKFRTAWLGSISWLITPETLHPDGFISKLVLRLIFAKLVFDSKASLLNFEESIIVATTFENILIEYYIYQYYWQLTAHNYQQN